MKQYLLDTSVIIDYLRGEKKSIQIVDDLEGHICSSFLCLSELYEGVYRVKNKAEVKKVIEGFFSGLSNVYGVDYEISEMFGSLRASLKKKGTIIEDIDIFIGATCLVYDLILVTNNIKHFSKVDGLKLYLEK